MIKLICVGKIKEKYLTDGVNDYFKRINKYHKFEIIEVDDSIPSIDTGYHRKRMFSGIP